MSYVFVLDTNKQPLNPVHPGWARKLLSSGRAAVYKRYPFTIILKSAVPDAEVQPLRLKIDPGSKTTGLAIVNDDTGDVVFAAELNLRGQQIKKSLDARRAIRRGRRNRKTRYRKPRFNNRRRKECRPFLRQPRLPHPGIEAAMPRGCSLRSPTTGAFAGLMGGHGVAESEGVK